MTQTREQPDSARRTAPRENRTAVVDPPFDQIGRLVADNVRERTASNYDFQGRSLSDLSNRARAELLTAARRWTAAYRDIGPIAEDFQGPIFLAGHQPELFHPGVWFKNFALGAIAQEHGAVAVNLIIDSDTIKTAGLPTLGGSLTEPRVETIPFDGQEPLVPYEERSLVDNGLFADFGRRVSQRIGPLVQDPLIDQFWPLVLERTRDTDRLGYCLAQARHQLEGRWGLTTLEIPQSWVCECESFRWFVAHMLAHLPRFRQTYNEAVRDYRRMHRIRNAAHPVPDLTEEGPWLETPLWVWTADRPERRRLFARSMGREMIVSDQQDLELRLPLDPDGQLAATVEELTRWSRQGVKIRSRALMTTLWARLALGDLFLHGIGGAKYDQVTDMLIERFFGLKPPGIMVVSATLHLPVESPQVAADDAHAIRQELRELTFHPEKFIGLGEADGGLSQSSTRPSPDAQSLIDEKQRWIQTPETPEIAYTRWKELRRINSTLQPYVADRRERLLELQKRTSHALRAKRILESREFGFCLYPEEILREFFRQLLPKIE